ncbi:MAG TPA: terminase family protein [Allosphingosinicella sp.]|nr:terminase family protein [Allosphingosinicella sp.]
MTRAEMLAVLLALLRLPPELRRIVFMALPAPARWAILEEWWWQARGGQIDPGACPDGSPWRVWAIIAGRGFGKTRAGAEWVWARARENPRARIALVGATLDEVADVMVEGDSGLLACARCDEAPRWIATRGLFLFPSGAQAHAFTADRPDKLRGPQHHFAWCDELAKFPRAGAAWDNLMLGLRLGETPRAIVTTTPKPIPALKRILGLPRTVTTHGRTADNPDSAPDFRTAMYEQHGGTRFGQQELEGLLLEDFEGALWTWDLIDKARGERGQSLSRAERDSGNGGAESDCPRSHGAESDCPRSGGDSGNNGAESDCPRSDGAQSDCPRSDGAESDCPRSGAAPHSFVRTVIGLDPPASTDGNSCGIVVCAMDEDGVAHVLADLTAQGLSPEAWARRVAAAADQYGASRVVAEKNQGGDMIKSVLRAVDADLPIRLVAATRSKAARAEPIALRFETGRARLAGHFPELEDQLCALTWDGYQGAGSPDRADAMVWAMTELFDKERGGPRIARL